MIRLKNNYNFDVVKLHLKFNQRTKSTPHKFQICFPSQNLILFQPDLCQKGMRIIMEIILGKNAGFCYGVNNAVTKAEEYVKSNKNKKVYCLGELVHNQDVTNKLEKEGLKFIKKVDEIDENVSSEMKQSLIIRAHGEPKCTYETLKKKNIEIFDLTCPNVLAIHKIVEKYVDEGYYVFLIGEKKHPEVIGTYGFGDGKCSIIESEEDIKLAFEELTSNKILVVSQTTFKMEKFEQFVNQIKDKVKEMNDNDASNKITLEIKNTICNATRLRQEETEKISKEVEYMIIIGGKNSANTRKLYEISAKNCKNAILIQNYLELENDYKEELKKIKMLSKVGIMAGASTPRESIDEVISLLY